MRSKKMFTVLEAIAETGEGIVDCMRAYLGAGYGASLRRMEWKLSKIQNERAKNKFIAAEERLLDERLRAMLHRLNKAKLISEDPKQEGRWRITPKGNATLESLRKDKAKHGLMPELFCYHAEPNDHLVIVVFDIPEKEGAKRDWLRAVLQHLGFKMLQKSVWIGKIKIPKILLEDLKSCKLIHAVEIFSVSKSGGLQQVL